MSNNKELSFEEVMGSAQEPIEKKTGELSFEDVLGGPEAKEPEKGFVSRVVDTVKGAGQELIDDPAQAALAGGSAAAESYGSLKGGELLSHGLGKLGVNKAIATGVGMIPGVRAIKPLVEPALGMLEFAGGAALTQSGIKKGEEAVGISDAIDQSQAANPNISTAAGTAVMGGMAAKSLKGYKNMLANEGIGKTALQAGGAAVGGAAFPYIDYGARKGINAVAGEGTVGEIPVPTSEEVMHSARDMALLGGMGYKGEAKPAMEQKAPAKPAAPVKPVGPADAPDLEQVVPDPEALAKTEATIEKANAVTVQAVEATAEVAPETSAALAESAATPIVPKEVVEPDATASEVSSTTPNVTAAAQQAAEKLGIDITQVPANKQGNVTVNDIRKWQKSQPPIDETQTPPQQLGTEADQAGQNEVAGGLDSATVEDTAGQPEAVALHDSDVSLDEADIPEHAFEESEQPPLAPSAEELPPQGASAATEIPVAEPTAPVAGEDVLTEETPVTTEVVTPTEPVKPLAEQLGLKIQDPLVPRLKKGETALKFSVTTSTDRIGKMKELAEQGRYDEIRNANRTAILSSVADIPGIKIKIRDVEGVYKNDPEISASVYITARNPAELATVRSRMAAIGQHFEQMETIEEGLGKGDREQLYSGTPDQDGYHHVFSAKVKTSGLDASQLNKARAKSGFYAFTVDNGTLEIYDANYTGKYDPEFRTKLERLHEEIANLGGVHEGTTTIVSAIRGYSEDAGKYPGTTGYTSEEILLHSPEGRETRLNNPISRRLIEMAPQIYPAPAGGRRSYFVSRDLTKAQIRGGAVRADHFGELPIDDLKNPVVEFAYKRLAGEIGKQYDALTEDRPNSPGTKFYFQDYGVSGEPYKNSSEVIRDIRTHNKLKVLKTDANSFGPEGSDFSTHPLLEDSGRVDANGVPLSYNDLFRAVHDAIAHGMYADQFGPIGEEGAWNTHIRTLNDPWARWALTTETRGQNSWINYNKSRFFKNTDRLLQPGEEGYVPIKDRPFADQKAALLPLSHVLTGDALVDAPVKELMQKLGKQKSQGSLPPKAPKKINTKNLYPDLKRSDILAKGREGDEAWNSIQQGGGIEYGDKAPTAEEREAIRNSVEESKLDDFDAANVEGYMALSDMLGMGDKPARSDFNGLNPDEKNLMLELAWKKAQKDAAASLSGTRKTVLVEQVGSGLYYYGLLKTAMKAARRVTSNREALGIGETPDQFLEQRRGTEDTGFAQMDDHGSDKIRDEENDLLRKPATQETPKQTEVKKTLLRYMDGTELVQRVLAHRDSTPLQRKIAQILLSNKSLEKIPVGIFDRLSPGSEAEYDPARHTIAISRENSGSELNPQTSLHEVFHALTKAFFHPDNASLLTPPQKVAVKGLKTLFENSRARAEEMGLTSKEKYEIFSKDAERAYEKSDMEHYGWSSVDEFISEAMTNEDFQEQLRSIEVTNSITGQKTTAWDFFKNTLRGLLGLPKADNSVLSHAIDHILELSMSDTPIGIGENGEVLRGRAYKENEKLRAVIGKPKAYLGKTVQEKQGGIVAEPAQRPFATDHLEAKRSLWALMNSDTDRFVKGRGGIIVDLRNPDPATAVKMGKPGMDLLEARVFHATGEHDNYAVPNPDKVASAPLVPQTIKQADFSGKVTLKYDRAVNATRDRFADHQQSHFFLKVYEDPQSPTGVRWHVVLADPQGKLITQYSSPALSGVAREGTITAIGPAPAKASRAEEVLLGDTPDSAPTSTPPKAGNREKARTYAEAQGDQDEGHTEVMANGDKLNNAQGVEELKRKISGMPDDQFIQRAVELGAKQDAGHELSPEELGEQQAINEDSRFGGALKEGTLRRPATVQGRGTEKPSEAQENEVYPDAEKETFLSQKRAQAEEGGRRYVDNGGTFDGLLNRNVPLTRPEVLNAAAIFRDQFGKVKQSLKEKASKGEKLTAKDILDRNSAIDQEDAANRLIVQMKSEGGQLLGHGQNLSKVEATRNVDDYIKSLTGGSVEELSGGKMNIRGLFEGLKDLKQRSAEITLEGTRELLAKNGITDPEAISNLQKILAHPDTSFRDLRDAISSILPDQNPAKAQSLAEQMGHLYNLTTGKLAKDALPDLVHNAYNGESVIPHGDEFLRKLNKYIKLGKFDQDEINQSLLESLGVHGYNAEFIKEIRADVDKLQTMPEGDRYNSFSSDILNKVAKKYNEQVLKNWKSGKNLGRMLDMTTAAWQAGVLSGPPTMGVNLIGSAMSISVESVMEGLGYAFKTKNPKYVADAFGGFLNALTGNKATGLPSAAKMEFESSMAGKGTKYRNINREESPHLENIETANLTGPLKVIAGHADRLKYVGRIMSALDAVNMTAADEGKQRMAMRFFLEGNKDLTSKEVHSMMEDMFNPDETVVASARETAEQEAQSGLLGDAGKEQARWIKRRTYELLSNRREQVLKGITEQGRSAAEHFTYNDQATGILGKYIAGNFSKINNETKVSKFFFSFMNTLSNIVNQTIDYTPYGALRASNKSISQKMFKPTDKFAPMKFEEGSPEQAAQYARAIGGTLTLLTLGYLAYQGMEEEAAGKEPFFSIHGAGPSNPMDKQQLIATKNWQPNSVRLGGQWYRYVDWPIVGIALGGLGTIFDTYRYKKDEQTTMELAQAAAISSATTVFDKNLLQGATNLFQAIRGNSVSQQANSMKRLAGGTIGGFTNPGLARWARNTFGMDKNGEVARLDQGTTEGWIYSMVPFSIGYDTPALNTLGEPIKQSWHSATTWRFADFSNIPPHPIITPLVKGGLLLPNPDKATQFQFLDKDGAVLKTRMGKHPEIFRRYVELRGQAMKEALTPDVIQDLVDAAKENKVDAQSYLDSKIGGAVRKYAVQQIEQEIDSGKLRVN